MVQTYRRRWIVSFISIYSLPLAADCCSQDTNTVQYELMKHIASANKCVTIVGDPDQSSELLV